MTSTTGFKGTVGGVTYTDRKQFEKAARGLGYRRGMGNRSSKAKLGTEVQVRLGDAEAVAGQIWSQADADGFYWVALSDGTYLALRVSTGEVFAATSGAGRSKLVGRLAA